MSEVIKFNFLLGKIVTEALRGEEELLLIFEDGSKFRYYHNQDCCEGFELEDVVGDLKDLIGSPLLVCEQTGQKRETDEPWGDSTTWTFYKLATVKGYVDLKFRGSSNGYYSEECDLEYTDPDGNEYNEWDFEKLER